VPAPESAHAIAAGVDEAVSPGSREETVLLFNLSGHCLLDLSATKTYSPQDAGCLTLTPTLKKNNHENSDSIPPPAALLVMAWWVFLQAQTLGPYGRVRRHQRRILAAARDLFPRLQLLLLGPTR